jgi:site-specific DNA-cytosine methylase
LNRIVDLFCGIGGVAEATRCFQSDTTDSNAARRGIPATIVAAIDIDRRLGPIYAANHAVTPRCQTLESIGEVPSADLWWLSPPCQPYTRRGSRLAEHDPRSQALAHLIDLIGRDRPEMIGLENVPQFADSDHHQRLVQELENAGYSVRTDVLCPTQWGVPMRRQRLYLRARRDGRAIGRVQIHRAMRPLMSYLDQAAWSDPSLHFSPRLLQQYQSAVNIVEADDPAAQAACFTSAYGKSPVRSGSYLHCQQRAIVRRFSPLEIARLMGFRDNFRWPAELDQRARYGLLGNSLSVTVVRAVLKSLLAESPIER